MPRIIRISIHTAVKRYMHRLHEDELMRENTRRGYKASSNLIIKFFNNKQLKDVTHADIEFFVNHTLMEADHDKGNGYSYKTRKECLSRLHEIFNYHHRNGEIKNNPFVYKVKVKRTKNAVKKKAYTPNEIDKVVNVADGNGIVEAFLASYSEGLRPSELIALSERDFNSTEGTLTVDKTMSLGECNSPKTELSKRTICINEQTQRIIENQINSGKARLCTIRKRGLESEEFQDKFIFFNPSTGLGWKDIKQLSQALAPYFKAAGVQFRGVQLARHAFVTHMYKAGFTFKDIAEIVGHVSEETTKKFYMDQSEYFRGESIRAMRNSRPLINCNARSNQSC